MPTAAPKNGNWKKRYEFQLHSNSVICIDMGNFNDNKKYVKMI